MLNRAQIETIRAAMEEEHRRDREALARLMRFLPLVGMATDQANGTSQHTTWAEDATRPASILGGLRWIIKSLPERTWTAQQLRAQLEKTGYKLEAKNPIATIGVALKKLCDRGDLLVVRRGSGREPNIYQWKRVSTTDCELNEEETG